MNKSKIILLALLLAGCTGGSVTINTINKGILLCKANDGLIRIEVNNVSDGPVAVCLNDERILIKKDFLGQGI